MRKTLKIHLLSPLLLLGCVEAVVLYVAVQAGMILGYGQTDAIEYALITNGPQAAVFTAVFLLTKYAIGLYHPDYASSISQTVLRQVATFAIGFILLSVVFYVFPAVRIWRSGMAVSLPLAFLGLLASRWAFRRIDSSYLKRRIVVIGVGDQAARIEKMEESDKGCRFSVAAFIDIAGEEPKVSRDRVVGKVNSLAEFVESNTVDEVVVAVQERRGRLPLRSLIDCRLAGTPISDYQTFCERETGRIDLDVLRPDWFVFSDGFPGGHLQQTLKRGLDVVLGVLALVLLTPLLAATAAAIRLESSGPVLYRQQRVGFRGRSFTLLKFRSMRVDAEKDGVPKWAAKDDLRITAVGAFIRKTRIDEIPQLFNVLKGDMSFVGPRPERPYFVEQLCQIIPYYEIRHRVKPGITGWAQLNYPYGASVEDAWHKLQFDLYYIKYYSILRDIVIILQTIRVIVIPHGAR
jgi:sugar transferase (PEP-CTERM system associated)